MTVEEMRKLVAKIAEHLNLHDDFNDATPAFVVEEDDSDDDANTRLYVSYATEDDEVDLIVEIGLL